MEADWQPNRKVFQENIITLIKQDSNNNKASFNIITPFSSERRFNSETEILNWRSLGFQDFVAIFKSES